MAGVSGIGAMEDLTEMAAESMEERGLSVLVLSAGALFRHQKPRTVRSAMSHSLSLRYLDGRCTLLASSDGRDLTTCASHGLLRLNRQ